MLASHIPGRLRVRDRALRGAASERLAVAVGGLPGVREAVANPVAGSLLVSYDPAALDLAALLAALGPAARAGAEERMPALPARKLIHAGMVATFGLSVAAALAGATRAHVVLGLAFGGLVVVHVINNRRVRSS